MTVFASTALTTTAGKSGFMAARGTDKRPELEEGLATPQYFVAIHSEVQDALKDWQGAKQHKTVAKKVRNLIKALVKGDLTTVDAVLRQLAVDPIRGCNGLVEIGPKQCRGGAARAFLFRGFNAAFLVAAGIEKGSTGVRIGEAKGRTEEIRKVFKERTRTEAIAAIQNPQGSFKLIRREAKQ